MVTRSICSSVCCFLPTTPPQPPQKVWLLPYGEQYRCCVLVLDYLALFRTFPSFDRHFFFPFLDHKLPSMNTLSVLTPDVHSDNNSYTLHDSFYPVPPLRIWMGANNCDTRFKKSPVEDWHIYHFIHIKCSLYNHFQLVSSSDYLRDDVLEDADVVDVKENSHLVPNSVVQFGSSFHTGQHIRFSDLHFRNAITQRKHKKVLALFGVSVEDDALRIEGAKLKVGGDAAGEAKTWNITWCWMLLYHSAVEFPLRFSNSSSDSSQGSHSFSENFFPGHFEFHDDGNKRHGSQIHGLK